MRDHNLSVVLSCNTLLNLKKLMRLIEMDLPICQHVMSTGRKFYRNRVQMAPSICLHLYFMNILAKMPILSWRKESNQVRKIRLKMKTLSMWSWHSLISKIPCKAKWKWSIKYMINYTKKWMGSKLPMKTKLNWSSTWIQISLTVKHYMSIFWLYLTILSRCQDKLFGTLAAVQQNLSLLLH